MKKPIAFVIAFVLCLGLLAQNSTLPLALYSSPDTTKPLIFYISGDGGFNKFSVGFMHELNKQGFAVIGLNAREYFWSRKRPEEAATAIEAAINESNKGWKRKNIVLLGYSFGADVAPFILTRFSSLLATQVTNLVLLSPSVKTDFEIHVLQMLGWGKSNGQSVPAEVNRISKPTLIITGDDENEFPFQQVKGKNMVHISMPGGHHYDGDITTLSRQIVQRIK